MHHPPPRDILKIDRNPAQGGRDHVHCAECLRQPDICAQHGHLSWSAHVRAYGVWCRGVALPCRRRCTRGHTAHARASVEIQTLKTAIEVVHGLVFACR